MIIRADNHRVHIVSCGPEALECALDLAWHGQKATRYRICDVEGIETLFFSWEPLRDTDSRDVLFTRLPFELDRIAAGPFVENWLRSCKRPPIPDFDGDEGDGFRIFNDSPRTNQYQFIAIQFAWAIYHK